MVRTCPAGRQKVTVIPAYTNAVGARIAAFVFVFASGGHMPRTTGGKPSGKKSSPGAGVRAGGMTNKRGPGMDEILKGEIPNPERGDRKRGHTASDRRGGKPRG
jgi:hypothetical protein